MHMSRKNPKHMHTCRMVEAALWVPSAALRESSRFHATNMAHTPFNAIGRRA